MAENETKAAETKPVIVEAVGSASNKGGLSSTAMEQAMAAAGLKAMEEGITDPNVIRERKLEARRTVRDAARAADASVVK